MRFDDLADMIADEILSVVNGYQPGRKRLCLCGCGERFTPKRDNQVYADGSRCGRRAHYVPFNVARIRGGPAPRRRRRVA